MTIFSKLSAYRLLQILSLLILTACQPRMLLIDPAMSNNPQDPAVLSGVLDNGFSYYLRSANSSLHKRDIEIRLIVRAGSIHEAANEQGYAHLLEHLVYRGTENFSGKQIEALLEDSGLRWGADVNATTHYGATIYRFSLTESEADLMPVVLALAADFMDAVNFNESDLNAEKRIVEAEWRFRYGHRNFVVDPLVDAALIGSEYKSRPPVGDLHTIRAATADSLRSFWRRNYRAPNAALIVTGNIVPWEIESLVKKRFDRLPDSSIDRPAGAKERFTPIKVKSEAEHLTYVNPDLLGPRVSLNFVSRVKPTASVESLRESFREDLLFKAVGHMITVRLAATSRCNSTALHSSLLETGQSVNGVDVDVADKDYLSCLQGLSAAASQLFENGLTRLEYEQLQRSFRSIAIDTANRYRNNSPEDFAARLTQLVVYGTPVLPASLQETHYLEMIDSVSAADFNYALSEIPEKYKTIYTAASPTGNKLPEKTLMALATESSESKKFVPIPPSRQILHGVLNPDQMFSSLAGVDSGIEKLRPMVESQDYREWQLSNGTRVIYKKNDHFDYVALAAVAPGGYLLSEGTYSLAAKMLPDFIGVNGAGGYLQKSLQRLRSEKDLFSEVQVNPTHHGIFAYGVADDVDLLLELVSAYFDEPVIVEPASSILIRKINKRLAKSELENNYWQKFISVNDTPLETSHMRIAQRQLFRTPADFTFVITGSVDADILSRELRRLERHSEKSKSASKIRPVMFVPSSADKLIMESSTDNNLQRMNVSLIHACVVPSEVREEVSLKLQLLADIIERRLRYDIRENSGLSYQLESQLLTENTGDGRRYHQIDFSVRSQDASRAQVLVASVLNAIGQAGVTESEMQFARKRERKRRRDLKFDYLAYATEMAYLVQNGGSIQNRSVDVSLAEVNLMARCFSSDNGTFVASRREADDQAVLSFD